MHPVNEFYILLENFLEIGRIENYNKQLLKYYPIIKLSKNIELAHAYVK